MARPDGEDGPCYASVAMPPRGMAVHQTDSMALPLWMAMPHRGSSLIEVGSESSDCTYSAAHTAVTPSSSHSRTMLRCGQSLAKTNNIPLFSIFDLPQYCARGFIVDVCVQEVGQLGFGVAHKEGAHQTAFKQLECLGSVRHLLGAI